MAKFEPKVASTERSLHRLVHLKVSCIISWMASPSLVKPWGGEEVSEEERRRRQGCRKESE
jgi:hypothetical protein